MRKSITELLEQYKKEVVFRTDRTRAPFGSPQLSEEAVFFDLAEKTRAVAHGGLPLIHQIAIARLCVLRASFVLLMFRIVFPIHDFILVLVFSSFRFVIFSCKRLF